MVHNNGLREKLEEMNGGYGIEDYCVGRFFVSSLLHPQASSFTIEERKEIGNLITQRAYADFGTCASTANLITSHLFNFGLPNIRDQNAGYERFSSEVDVMRYYAQNYQNLGINYEDLSSKAVKNIAKYKNPTKRKRKKEHRDVEVYFLTRDSLLNSSPQLDEGDLGSFQGFKIRPKIDVGEKFLIRASKLFAPSKKDLESTLVSNEVGEDYLREQTITYLTAVLNSGRDFHEFRQDDSINYKILDPRYLDVEEFLDKVGDLFLIDTGGATIYTENKSIHNVHSSMQHLNRMNILNLIPHRYEDNSSLKDPEDPFSYDKDGAVLYGIQGMLGSSFCEVRFNTPLRGLEGTIGCKEHKGYKSAVNRDFTRRLNSSKLLKEVKEYKDSMF